MIQTIKAATDDDVMGDQVSSEILQAADDLYHLRIPARWSALSGEASPPPTWTLAAWFTEFTLANRFAHIDRIIVQVCSCFQWSSERCRCTCICDFSFIIICHYYVVCNRVRAAKSGLQSRVRAHLWHSFISDFQLMATSHQIHCARHYRFRETATG